MTTCLQVVHVNASVTALSCDEFVERIPGNALDVVVMFRDLANDVTVLDVDDTRDEIGAADSQRLAIGTPGHIVEFLLRGTAHEFDSPELLFELALAFESSGDVAEARFAAVAWDPKEDIAVITSGGEQLTLGAEANDIDDARVSLEGSEVFDARWMWCDDGGA